MLGCSSQPSLYLSSHAALRTKQPSCSVACSKAKDTLTLGRRHYSGAKTSGQIWTKRSLLNPCSVQSAAGHPRENPPEPLTPSSPNVWTRKNFYPIIVVMRAGRRAILRFWSGLTQHQLRHSTGISTARISLWENSLIILPQHEVRKIARVLCKRLHLTLSEVHDALSRGTEREMGKP